MTKPNLRPALVYVDGMRVYALELTEVDSVLAIPAGRSYRDIGGIFQEYIEIDGLRAQRWFAGTVVDSNLGPFTSRPLAVLALIEWNHLRGADVQETSAPLF